MKKKSKTKSGFTLLETVISMMIIAIISVGVYNAFLMLIRTTKDGEVKQEAALLGKRVIEEIKSGNRNIESNESVYFDKDGNSPDINSEVFYKVEVQKYIQNISINNMDNNKRFYIGNNEISKDDKNIENTDILQIKTIVIEVNNEGEGTIGFKDDELNSFSIDDISSVSLDFNHISKNSKATVEINNISEKPLNLYVWNSKDNDDGKSNVKINNVCGILNQSYKNGTDDNTKSGDLYRINIAVYKKNGTDNFDDKLFDTDIYDNIQ